MKNTIRNAKKLYIFKFGKYPRSLSGLFWRKMAKLLKWLARKRGISGDLLVYKVLHVPGSLAQTQIVRVSFSLYFIIISIIICFDANATMANCILVYPAEWPKSRIYMYKNIQCSIIWWCLPCFMIWWQKGETRCEGNKMTLLWWTCSFANS